jgi:urease accessory protein
MIRLTRSASTTAAPDVSVTLTLEQRSRGRLRVTLDDGRKAGVFVERGSRLHDGDRLVSEATGLIVAVRAAPEPLSALRCTGALPLARACYHLGNRHVPLQIQEGVIRYPHDPVLDAMLRGLGFEVFLEHAPFEPEPGAYVGHAGGGHAHADA